MGDHQIAFDPNDRFVGRAILLTGSWGRQSFQDVVALLHLHRPDKRTGVFLDTGANIGTQTLYALLSGEFTRAIAIEPVAKNLRLLRLNGWLNNLSDHIDIVPVAAGSEAAILPMLMDPRNSGGHSLKELDGVNKVLVTVRTIESILADLSVSPQSVGMWWIDVEGYEPEVVAGGRSLIEASVPLHLEFNPRLYEGRASSFLREVAPHYTRAFVVRENGLDELEIPRLMTNPPERLCDILFL